MRASRVLVALVVLAAAFGFTKYWDFVLTPPIGHAKYQAVFLSNGQTYFGRYLDRLGPYVKIENAFYIQQQPAQQQTQNPELKLVRRGSELHQPDAEMLVPKDAILFVEDLRPDSQVAQFMDRNLP
ncbi:MAG TPA: hypothetical protein VFC31_09230 [Candidatus Limnocylindria bacterium]|nr:hypothetical protein [Candidatus Limnocylindria bacterium]